MAQQKQDIIEKLRASAKRVKLVIDRLSVKEDIRVNGEIDDAKTDVSNVVALNTSMN